MNTIDYLNHKLLQGLSHKEALTVITEDFAIKVSWDARFPDLYVLNYNQIESPKSHPIVKECRSLVISGVGEFSVVSRSFDRFFNYGESDTTPNINDLVAHEKVDGSLLALFYTEKYGWLYRTRSMIMPESAVMGWSVTWRQLIEEALGAHYKQRISNSMEHTTLILEVVSPENRVVTRYDARKAYLLAIRDNITGAYYMKGGCEYTYVTEGIPDWQTTKEYKFSTLKDCISSAKELRNLEEGFVMYDTTGTPICKVKNPAYVAAHHLRGEGLNPKRMMELILMNEQAEYLAIFPEDKERFEPYMSAYEQLLNKLEFSYSCVSGIENQKDFALQVKDLCYSAILFQARAKGTEPAVVWNNQKDSYKLKVLQTFKETLNA